MITHSCHTDCSCMMNWTFIGFAIVIMALGFQCCQGKRILLLPPSFTSHMREVAAIGDILVDQGHEAYMVVSETYPAMAMFENKKVKLIIHEAKYPDVYTMGEEKITEHIMDMLKSTVIDNWRKNSPELTNFCRNPLADDKLYAKLKQMNFDLAIVDIFPMSRCLLVLPYSLGIPYVGISTSFEPWLSRTPALPSFAPSNLISRTYTDKMPFWQRFRNTWEQVDWAVFPRMDILDDGFFKKYIKEKEPLGMNELVSKCMLFLMDVDVLMDYPRPTMPNEIMIGGLTTQPAKELPPDIATFIGNSDEPIIIMTFGSTPFNMNDEIKTQFLVAFGKIKYKILWKYTGNVQDVSDNVKVVKWLPQNDILGHPKTKVFITHCGNNGQMESLYHGVPMIGYPIFGDQPYNCKRMAANGYGICLNPSSFQAQDLVDAVNEVMSNSTYETNIMLASKIFKDRPMNPKDTAGYWVNHVMRFGAEHIRSHALDLPMYQYLMLDIAAFIVIILLCIIVMIFCIAYQCKQYFFNQRHHLKTN